jgi:hypothetical protein
MVLWNLLDGGSSHKGPLLRPSESPRCGTTVTHPHHLELLEHHSFIFVILFGCVVYWKTLFICVLSSKLLCFCIP